MKSGDIVRITYKTIYMSEPETEEGTIHIEPDGNELWFESWDDESIELCDILTSEVLYSKGILR